MKINKIKNDCGEELLINSTAILFVTEKGMDNFERNAENKDYKKINSQIKRGTVKLVKIEPTKLPTIDIDFLLKNPTYPNKK